MLGFFAFENLYLLGNRHREVYSVGLWMVWRGPRPHSVQGVG